MLPVVKPLIPIVSKFFDDDWNIQKNWSQLRLSTDQQKITFNYVIISYTANWLMLLLTASTPDIGLRMNSNCKVQFLNY